jgi:cytochrome P450
MASTRPIPGPRGKPIIGMIPEMARDMLGMLMNITREYGGIVQFKLVNKPCLLVTNPDYVKHILQDQYRNYIRGRSMKNPRLLLGDGLPMTDGDFWLRERRLMQPAFHRQRLLSLVENMTQIIAARLEGWKMTDQLEMENEMSQLTLTIIIHAMFSARVADKTQDLARSFNVASKFMLWRSQQIWAPPLWMPVPKNVAYNRALKKLNEIVYPLIEEARQNPGDDLLDMLLQARDEHTGEDMTDKQARDEVVTIFFAGHETSAMTMTWMFYLLLQHPDVEMKLRREIAEVLSGRTPTFSDLPKLTYTQKVIQETLRLYPAAYMFVRETETDQTLDGYEIPAGMLIFITPYVTHRDAKFWADPERFDPERFDLDQVAQRPLHVYFPFGEGPHLCIGNNFAMIEMQLILTMALQRFHFKLAPGQKIELLPAATLRPKYGLRLNVEPT